MTLDKCPCIIKSTGEPCHHPPKENGYCRYHQKEAPAPAPPTPSPSPAKPSRPGSKVDPSEIKGKSSTTTCPCTIKSTGKPCPHPPKENGYCRYHQKEAPAAAPAPAPAPPTPSPSPAKPSRPGSKVDSSEIKGKSSTIKCPVTKSDGKPCPHPTKENGYCRYHQKYVTIPSTPSPTPPSNPCAKILCMNTNGHNPAAGDAAKAVKSLVQRTNPDIVLLQEYKWSNVSLDALIVTLPGTWTYVRQWYGDGNNERDAVVAFSDDVFSGTAPGYAHRPTGEFDTRYAAAHLTWKKNREAQVLVYSYHGKNNGDGVGWVKKSELSMEFIQQVQVQSSNTVHKRHGGLDYRKGLPAIIAGDWNSEHTGLKHHVKEALSEIATIAAPDKKTGYERRTTRKNKAQLDYAVLIPFKQSSFGVSEVKALAIGPKRLQDKFDHDPIVFEIELKTTTGPTLPATEAQSNVIPMGKQLPTGSAPSYLRALMQEA